MPGSCGSRTSMWHGRAAGLVGARGRPGGGADRLLAAEAGASAAERAGDLARRHVGRDPGPIRQLMTEPGGLPLGVATGVALALLRRRREIHLALEMPDPPRHTVRRHR